MAEYYINAPKYSKNQETHITIKNRINFLLLAPITLEYCDDKRTKRTFFSKQLEK